MDNDLMTDSIRRRQRMASNEFNRWFRQ